MPTLEPASASSSTQRRGKTGLDLSFSSSSPSSHTPSLRVLCVFRYFATGSADTLVGLWDINELICLRTFSRLSWPVRTIGFSYDGEYLAAGSEDDFIDIVSRPPLPPPSSLPLPPSVQSPSQLHLLSFCSVMWRPASPCTRSLSRGRRTAWCGIPLNPCWCTPLTNKRQTPGSSRCLGHENRAQILSSSTHSFFFFFLSLSQCL